jgi:spore cortex formation protein SpoVR/YcgB (stage V sporulation)
MKTFTIIVYNDPSHAWGKVKRKVLDNLGIAKEVSSHSYQYKDNVYLEEDADLSLVCRHLLFNTDVQIKFVEKHTNRDSRIRSYERYVA